MKFDITNLDKKLYNKFIDCIYISSKIIYDLIGIDMSEDIYIYTTHLDNSFGGTFSLVGFGNSLREDAGKLTRYIFTNDEREKAIFKAYDMGMETFIEINIKHIEEDSKDEIIDTVIHELLHHLTIEEEEEHGERWCDLANYISKNSKYNVLKSIYIK